MLSSVEEATPLTAAWVPTTLFPSHQDAQVAQAILSVIATSIMTVVSIVFAILLMTLTLASMQFSPRILISFVRDRGTQWTLGIFLGTFCYCIAALPAARSLPHPFAPVLTVLGAMLLALVCVGWLLFFIHHISQSISVNHIVDRIARETELVIDDLMPHPRASHYPHAPAAASVPDEPEFPILNEVSGYIRFIDTRRLVEFARMHHLRVRVTRQVGHFVPAGVPLLMVSRRSRLDRRPRRGTDRRVRHRADAHAAAGRRVRRHPDRRYRAARHLAGGQRPEHGDQLHRPAHPHPDPLGGPLPAGIAAVQPAACAARGAAVDRPGRVAEHRHRADPRLRHRPMRRSVCGCCGCCRTWP